MRHTSLLGRSAASFGIGAIAVLSLSAPASASDYLGKPATEPLEFVLGNQLDDPDVRQELNQIDSPAPAPAARPEVTEPLTVVVDDNAIELVQVAIGGLAGGLVVAAGATVLGIRHRRHGLQGA